jgi:hypothetical protein
VQDLGNSGEFFCCGRRSRGGMRLGHTVKFLGSGVSSTSKYHSLIYMRRKVSLSSESQLGILVPNLSDIARDSGRARFSSGADNDTGI